MTFLLSRLLLNHQGQDDNDGEDIGAADVDDGNDPCNYYGRNICDSSGQCDSERFDCRADDCINGTQGGITGQCDGDDRPYGDNDNDNENNNNDDGGEDTSGDEGCDTNYDFCDESEGCQRSDVDCIDDRGFDEDDYNG